MLTTPWKLHWRTDSTTAIHWLFPPLLRLGRRGGGESLRCTCSMMGLPLTYAFPPPALLPRMIRKIALSTGDAILDGAEVVPPASSAARRRRSPSPAIPGSSRRSHDGPAAVGGQSSSRMEDLRRLRCDGVSDEAFCLIGDSWRPSSRRRYDGIWRAFRDFLRAGRLSLSDITLRVVLDYLSDMFAKGRVFRTICLHCSVLSSTLPPFDGHAVGWHPLVT